MAAARIGAQVAAALAVAHRAEVVHRDIKPANILLEGDRVVVTDFGIAAMTGEATLTPAGAKLGTPAYMAPEQARGDRATAAADLWALGTTLYRLVEGRHAFPGRDHHVIMFAITGERPSRWSLQGALDPVVGRT